MKKLFRTFVAIMRWNLRFVCEESAGLGPYDYHDYRDSDDFGGQPWHFVKYTCRRCGKKFYI